MDPRRDPLTCDDLIDMKLANEAHCCQLCHKPELTGYFGMSGMKAVFVPTPDGEVRAEVCCSQALTVNAHEYVRDWTLPDISSISA
jgi:hypothetical protein